MNHQDRVSMIITFVIGLLVGSYLYVAGFSTIFSPDDVAEAEVYADLVVTGYSYGACSETGTCLAFQILGDGSYRAIYDATGEQVILEGSLTSALRRQLSGFTQLLLELDAQPLLTPGCAFGDTETNYNFTIELSTVVYVLDTCETAINYEGEVWTALVNTWAYLGTQS